MSDSLWVELFGRPWLPGLQALLVANGVLGGGLTHIKWLMFGVGAAMLITFAVYLWRRFGPGCAAVGTAILLACPDVLWVTAAPYQEALFYLGFAVSLLCVPNSNQPARIGLVLGCIICLCTRYEGIVWLACLAAVHTRHATTRVRAMWWTPVFVSAAAYAYLLRTTGLSLHSPSAELPQTDVLTHATYLLTYLFDSPAALWLVPAAIGAVVLYRDRPSKAVIAHDLFTLGFVAVYLTTAPYVPAGNRRFHLPLIVWLACRAGVGLRALIRAVPRGRLKNIVLTCISVGVAIACLLRATTAQRELTESARAHLSPARVGAVCERLIPEDRGLLMAWKPANYHGYPSKISMRIAAQLHTPRKRIVFAPEFERWEASTQVRALERRFGGVLLRRRKHDPPGIIRRHQRIEQQLRQQFGPALMRSRIAGGYELFTWGTGNRHVETQNLPTDTLPVDLHILGIPDLRAVTGDLARLRLEDIRWYPGVWPDEIQVMWKAKASDREASRIGLEFPVTTSTTQLVLRMTASQSGGNLRVQLDGRFLGEYDLQHSEPVSRTVEYPVELTPGIHRLDLELAAGDVERQAAVSGIWLHN